MLDKILYVSENRIVLIFTDRVINLTSDRGDALNLLAIVLSPLSATYLETDNEFNDLTKKVKVSFEDTQEIDVKRVS